jgi:hypothetical protein
MSNSRSSAKYVPPATRRKGSRAASRRTTRLAVKRSTATACVAPNASASLAVNARPLAAAIPIAIRHAVSSAVIPTTSAPPRISVRIPTGVARKNVARSTSATTPPSAPDITERRSNSVAGVSTANEMIL